MGPEKPSVTALHKAELERTREMMLLKHISKAEEFNDILKSGFFFIKDNLPPPPVKFAPDFFNILLT